MGLSSFRRHHNAKAATTQASVIEAKAKPIEQAKTSAPAITVSDKPRAIEQHQRAPRR